MIVPLCPMCGHQMYFAGLVKSEGSTFSLMRYACIHCDYVEDMIQVEGQDKEVLG